MTAEEGIESWSELTRDAVAGRHVLAIQDTSEIHISTRRGLGKGNVHGVLAHVMAAVDDETMAWRIVDWRRRRWIIEQLSRLMKSDGLRLEDSELESADGLMKLTVIAAKAACETLQRAQARDGLPEPGALTFTPNEIEVLDHLNDEKQGATALHPPHSLSWASWIIARLGGWNGYPKSRPQAPSACEKASHTSEFSQKNGATELFAFRSPARGEGKRRPENP